MIINLCLVVNCMFKKILKAYNLKPVKKICNCDKNHWCQDCLISRINPENTMLITGRKGDGSDAVRLI